MSQRDPQRTTQSVWGSTTIRWSRLVRCTGPTSPGEPSGVEHGKQPEAWQNSHPCGAPLESMAATVHHSDVFAELHRPVGLTILRYATRAASARCEGSPLLHAHAPIRNHFGSLPITHGTFTRRYVHHAPFVPTEKSAGQGYETSCHHWCNSTPDIPPINR